MINRRVSRATYWIARRGGGGGAVAIMFEKIPRVRIAYTTPGTYYKTRGISSSCSNNGSFTSSREKQQVAGRPGKDDLEDGKGTADDYRKKIAPWLKFGEHQKGLLSHLSNKEILRALFVLQICSFDTIVEKSKQLLDFSKKFGSVAEYIVRKTFYDQFVGGDEEGRMKQVVDLLHRRGLTLMVAPVLEEDVEDDKSNRQVYDENVRTLKSIARMTSSFDNDKPIVQLKLSAIMPAKTLELVNGVIRDSWNDSSKLAKIVEQMSEKISSNTPNSTANLSFLAGISKDDVEHFESGIRRANEFVQVASGLGVKVLVDAEFYSCQRAISTIALALMVKFNGNGYTVGDTIQGYLKDAKFMVDTELEVIGRLFGSRWYGKLVRGAYMDRERILATKRGLTSPIRETYPDTNASYDICVRTLLQYLAEERANKKSGQCGGTSHLLIATHNEKSIRLAVQEMTNINITLQDDLASFAQIYGMADYLSTPLVNSNYKVYKSTPYGPLAKVVPYLARRASENRSVLKGAREERLMLRKELLSRIF